MRAIRAGQPRVKAALIGGTIALAAFHLWVSSRISGPSVVYDEAGYLGNARWLLGDHHWEMPFSPSYAVGYPLLLAPIFAVVRDPDWQWRLSLALNAVLLASVFPLLYATLRMVGGVRRRPAFVAAGLGAIVPAVIAAGISAIAENLVLPLVVASVLAAWAMAEADRPRIQRCWFGLAACGLYLAHPRFTLVLPVAAVVLVVAALARRVDRKVLAINGGLLVVGAIAARLLTSAVQSSRWARVDRPEGGLDEWRPLFTTRVGLRELLTTAAGQAWYLLAGSFGLVLVGIALAAWTVLGRRRADALDLEPSVDGDEPAGHPFSWAQRFALAWFGAAAAVVFATSVLFFARNQFRVDHYVYGRHNDSFTPVWMGLAIAFLLTEPSLRRRIAAVAAPIVPIGLLGLVLVHERDPLAFDGRVSPFAAPAVTKLLTVDPAHAFRVATVLSIAGIVVLLGVIALERVPIPRTRPRVVARAVLIGALCSWFAYCGVEIANGTEKFEEFSYVDWTAPSTIERLDIEEIAINASAVESRAVLTFPFYLPDVAFTTYEAAWGESPGSDYALSTLDDQARVDAGDRIVLLDQGGLYEDSGSREGLAIWVRPGAEQDRLEAEGALLPEGFPTDLPAEARQARVVIRDRAGDTISVAPGGRIPLEVTVTHEGAGSPWPDWDSYAHPGHVRIVASVTPIDPDGEVGARSGGELPQWMLPGDEVDAKVEVVAVGQLLNDLPPGRYRVELGVSQDGSEWTADGGPDATFTMEVTPRR